MALWNPQVVLDLYHSPQSSTCSGTTLKGLRCRQSMISHADRAEAASIMHLMSCFEPHTWGSDVYKELAYLTLCPRWHRKPGYSQVSKVANQFQSKVQAFCSQRPRRNPTTHAGTGMGPPQQRIANGTVQLIGEASRPQPPMPRPRLLPPIATELTDDGLDSETESLSTASSAFSLSSTNTSSTSSAFSSSLTSTSSTSSTSSSSSSTSTSSTRSSRSYNHPQQLLTPSNSTSTSRRGSDGSISSRSPQNEQLHTPPATPRTSSPSTITPASPLSPIATTTRHSRHDRPLPPTPSPAQPNTTPRSSQHNHQPTLRKSTNDDCPICYESLTEESSIYCRRQCGTNVHRDCFKSWRLEQVRKFDVEHPLDGTETNGQLDAREDSRDAAVTCVYCRSQWMCEWE